jgi:hypothetical protein
MKLMILAFLAFMSCRAGAEIRHTIHRYNVSEIDSNLLYAIAAAESSLNEKAVGPTGDYGLFQITEIAYIEAIQECPTKLKGVLFPRDLLTAKTNTLVASCFIRAVVRQHKLRGPVELFAFYNCGSVCVRLLRAGRIAQINNTTKHYIIKALNNYYGGK